MENNNVLKDRKLHNCGISKFDALTKEDLLNSLRFQLFLDVQRASSALFFEHHDALRELVFSFSDSEVHFKLNDQLHLFVEFLSDFSFDFLCTLSVVDFKNSVRFDVNVPFLS